MHQIILGELQRQITTLGISWETTLCQEKAYLYFRALTRVASVEPQIHEIKIWEFDLNPGEHIVTTCFVEDTPWIFEEQGNSSTLLDPYCGPISLNTYKSIANAATRQLYREENPDEEIRLGALLCINFSLSGDHEDKKKLEMNIHEWLARKGYIEY